MRNVVLNRVLNYLRNRWHELMLPLVIIVIVLGFASMLWGVSTLISAASEQFSSANAGWNARQEVYTREIEEVKRNL